MHYFNDRSIEDYTNELLRLYNHNDTVVQPQVTDPPATESPAPQSEDNFSYFKAAIYTADQAYPVQDAKIELSKDGELVAYLITDRDGQTKTIQIQSPPAGNSLDPYSTQQSIDYSADVYAEGFVTKKNVLVSAVGDSFAILNLNIIPVPERVS